MQILKATNINFLGRRKYFLILSVVLILLGGLSMGLKGGLKLGIDFKGGTLVYAKFAEEPDTGRIRQLLEAEGFSVATLQPFQGDAFGGGPQSHELKIDLNLPEGASLSSGEEKIIEALRQIHPGEPGRLDFNAASAVELADRLKRNSSLVEANVPTEEIEAAARALVEFRDSPPQAGLVQNFSALSSVEGVNADIMAALQEETYLGAFAIRGIEAVGPKIGKHLQWQAFKATMYALGGMLLYIAFRFEWIYGVAAVAAVFHDVLITLGFFSLFDRELELTVIAALLTLVGYSMNDTIVIFDRVRENLKLTRRQPMESLVNLSVNQTLERTILTSGLTLVTVLCLFLFGGEVLRGFSFALVIGILVGTYSSIFVASPILLWWQGMAAARSGGKRRAR